MEDGLPISEHQNTSHILSFFLIFISFPPPPKKKKNNTNTQNCQKLVLFFLFRKNKMSKNLRGAGPKPSGAQGAVPRNMPPPSRAQDSCSRRPPPLRGPAPDGRPAMGNPRERPKGVVIEVRTSDKPMENLKVFTHYPHL